MQQYLTAESCYITFAAKLFTLDVRVGSDCLGLLWVLFVRLFSENHKSSINKKAYFLLKAESLHQSLAFFEEDQNLIQGKLYSIKKSK